MLEGFHQICSVNCSLWWSWEGLAGRGRGREADLRLLWECRLGGEGSSGTGALPTFTRVAEGPGVVSHQWRMERFGLDGKPGGVV